MKGSAFTVLRNSDSPPSASAAPSTTQLARSSAMAERTISGRFRFRKGVAFATVLLAVLGAASGGGHQFLSYFPEKGLSFHPDHRQPVRWDPDVWPPGATLSVAVAESELWASEFGINEDIALVVERSLSRWADIESADIRWKVETVAPYDELSKYPLVMFVDENTTSLGYAAIWRNLDSAGQFVSVRGCEIGLWPRHLPDENLVGLMVHELGHCLGLAHSDGSPFDASPWSGFGLQFPEPIWGWIGAMQFSGAFGLGRMPGFLSPDERVAASLLRPRAGWLQETGSIWGAVVVEGEPARAVYVLASPVDPETGRIGPGVGAYTHVHGTFDIRGLNPGTYALWVFDSGGASWPGSWGAEWYMDVEHHIHDTIWKMPVVVRAGERTGPVMIPVQRAVPEMPE